MNMHLRRSLWIWASAIGLAGAVSLPAARAEHSQELMDEIMAVRAARMDAVAAAAVRYKVRTPDSQWHAGYWASAPNGDVHAVGPLPPHPVFDEELGWQVEHLTHEVRQTTVVRVWSREDTEADTTEIAIEPGVTTLRERVAGHPLVYDLVVDRWLESDKEIRVEPALYDGKPAAYVRTAYGNQAWLLEEYDWAVAEMREVQHDWIARARGFDRVPLIGGSAPQELEWYLNDALMLEVALDGWEPAREDAAYAPSIEVGSGALHLADRRLSPATALDMPDLQAVASYLREGTVPVQVLPEPGPGVAERLVFVIDSATAHEIFSLDDMPWLNFGIVQDEGEGFGYLLANDPRMDPFSPLQPGDVILAIDGEEWRPENDRDIAWLLGRLTWVALWDKPFTLTVLRDGQMLDIELLWSYDQVAQG